MDALKEVIEEFSQLNTLEFVNSKAECYCGIRSIKKRLQEIQECAKCLLQIEEVQHSGNHQKINEFCKLQGYSKIFRNIIHREYYEERLYTNFSQQITEKKFGTTIDQFQATISDTESNMCELCHQLNFKTEMALITKEVIEKYSMFLIV